MASFYPKRGELWISYYEGGKRYQHAILDPETGFNLKDNRQNRKYAKEFALKKTTEQKSIKIKIVSLDYAIKSFLDQLVVNKDTLGDYEYRLNLFASQVGKDRELRAITDDDINIFEKYIRNKKINKWKDKEKIEVSLSETTISDYWRDIYGFFKYSREKEWIKKIPFERKKKVRKFQTIKRVIPISLMLKLFEEIKSNEKHYRVFKLLALTGFRPIEAANLTWENVDFLNNRIVFENTKVGREDIFPLSGNTYSEAVREFLWSFKQDTGKVLGYTNVNGFRFLNKRLKEIIGEQYTIYDIRKTFCTNLLLNGADIYSVQKLMRHKDIKTTLEHYTYIDMIKIGSNLDKIHDIYKQF